jgi:hypothetical protein
MMTDTMISAENASCRGGLPGRDSRRGRRSHTRRQTCGSGVSPRIAAGDGAPTGKHGVPGRT